MHSRWAEREDIHSKGGHHTGDAHDSHCSGIVSTTLHGFWMQDYGTFAKFGPPVHTAACETRIPYMSAEVSHSPLLAVQNATSDCLALSAVHLSMVLFALS